MIIYIGLLIALSAFNLGYRAKEGDEVQVVVILLRLVMLAPIYGRIFGWW